MREGKGEEERMTIMREKDSERMKVNPKPRSMWWESGESSAVLNYKEN